MKIRPQASEIVNFGHTKALRAVDVVDEVGSVRSGRALRVQCLLLARLFSLRTGCRILREGSLCSDGGEERKGPELPTSTVEGKCLRTRV